MDSGEGICSELNWEWVFDGNKITRQNPNGGETQEFTFKIDPTVSPKAFDLTWPKRKFTLSCIYEIKDDTLRICMSKFLAPTSGRRSSRTIRWGYCLMVLKTPNSAIAPAQRRNAVLVARRGCKTRTVAGL